MQLNLLGFTSATQRFAAAAQASTSVALDFTLGSVLRAIAEANAAVGLWVQWSILRVLSMTRLSTSTGVDVDSFVGDFGLMRLPGVSATGNVTLSRAAVSIGALVVPGTLMRTADNTALFSVAADPTNAAWSTTAGAMAGYFLPAGSTAITVPVVCLAPGQIGNVQAGTITLLATAVPGIDTVSNAAPCAGGVDAETDAALTSRFSDFIGSLSKATKQAVLYAAESVQQGLALQAVDGTPGSGTATLYVDDGSGSPSAELLQQIGIAVEQVRPFGLQVVIQPPTLVPVSISVALVYPVGTDVQAAEAAISSAIAAYLNALGMSQALTYTRLGQIILNAAPVGSDIGSLTLNGGVGSVTANTGQRVHLASLTVA